ncbi:MAG: PQQ-binding-like beta-propeller repeat protein [Pirellulaceae bacterium]
MAASLFWLAALFAPLNLTDDWAQFRGRNATGHAVIATQFEWDEKDGIRWSANLPGPGSSSPIVVGDRVFVTCYTGYGIDPENAGEPDALTRHLICFDRESGKMIWQTDAKSKAKEDPYKGMVPEHGYSSSTPVANERFVYVYYGKSGVYCYDMMGKEVWHRDLGTESDPMKFGDGSSPVLYENLVLVNAANTDRSVVALDQATGEVVWSTKDDRYKNCWASPMIVRVDNHDELVLAFPGVIDGFDPKTGKRLWRADSPMVDSIYGTLVEHNGIVLAMGGRNQAAIAVRCGGMGDVTDSHVVWKTRLQSSIGTPVVVGDNLLWASQGKAYCIECATGKIVFEEALGAGTKGHAFDYASPVVAGDEMMILFKSGQIAVIANGGEFELLRMKRMPEERGRFNASPAIAGKQMIIRSDKRLYSIQIK